MNRRIPRNSGGYGTGALVAIIIVVVIVLALVFRHHAAIHFLHHAFHAIVHFFRNL